MNPYQRFAIGFGRTRLFAWLGQTVVRPYDSYSRGRRIPDSTLGTDLPLVYLTTTGRRSGLPSTIPLLAIPSDEGGTIIVGTNWGRPKRPDWVGNLSANPTAVLERDGVAAGVTASRVAAADFDRYWDRFNEIWPYETYRKRSGRDPVMFVLTEE